jgi:hypothetical protein
VSVLEWVDGAGVGCCGCNGKGNLIDGVFKFVFVEIGGVGVEDDGVGWGWG